MEIKVTHVGEDYATIEVNGVEFQTSKGLGETIFEAQEQYDVVQYYSKMDFPAIGSRYEKEGNTYEVANNSVINQTTAKLVK